MGSVALDELSTSECVHLHMPQSNCLAHSLQGCVIASSLEALSPRAVPGGCRQYQIASKVYPSRQDDCYGWLNCCNVICIEGPTFGATLNGVAPKVLHHYNECTSLLEGIQIVWEECKEFVHSMMYMNIRVTPHRSG